MKTIKLLHLAQLIFLITSCIPSIPPDVQSLMVTSNNIPTGWVNTGENFDEKWGGTVYIVGFDYGKDVLSSGITHGVIEYTDKQSAIAGYEEYKKAIYRDFWFTPTEIEFTPSESNDLYTYKCVDSVKVNDTYVFDCLALQQHDNYVSAVQMRMGNPLTLEALSSILETIDHNFNN